MFQRRFWFLLLLVHLSSGSNTDSKWPTDKFGLPMSVRGCPVGPFRGSWVKKNDKGTEISKKFDLSATIVGKTITHRFCMKYSNTGNGSFSKGQYCVYKFLDLINQSCPEGMKSGYIHWNDSVLQQSSNLPAGIYLSTMRIYYCCRVDGDKTQPIKLPTEKPFFLLAYNSSLCQTVKWMEAWVEFLHYQRQDFLKENFTAGAHPFLSSTYKLYYCFYKGCHFKKNQHTGYIETGNDNIPSQSRYCSWSIISQTNSKLSLSFTFFNFTAKAPLNFVSVYDGKDSHGKHLGTFNAVKSPLKYRLITKSSSMFVLLRCFKILSESCRFKALYTSYHSTVEPTSIPYRSTEMSSISPENHSTTVPAKGALNSSSPTPKAVKKYNKKVTSAVLGTAVPLALIIIVTGFIICRKRRAKLRRCNRNEPRASVGDNFDASMESLLVDMNDSVDEISFVINPDAALRLYSDSDGSSSSGLQGADTNAQKISSKNSEYFSMIRQEEAKTTENPRYTEDLGETAAVQRSQNNATQLQEGIKETFEGEDEESSEQIDLKRLDESRILRKPRSKPSDTCDV